MLFPEALASCVKKFEIFIYTSMCMSSKNVSEIFKIVFQAGDIYIFVLCGVFFSWYDQLKNSVSVEKNIRGEI